MRVRMAVSAVIVVLLVLPGLARGGGDPFVLSPGDSIFISGPHIESSSGGKTFDYSVRVTEAGLRLRIGLDHPEVEDDFSLTVVAPGGTTSTVDTGGGLYSGEAVIASSERGTYRLKVNAQEVEDSNFRVRAKLESRLPSLGVKKGRVLPNLQVLPAHEASFLMPATNGFAAGNPIGVDLEGAESCHPEEHVEELGVRCLRFAYGVRNTGRGPLSMFYEGAGVGADKALYQRIFRADGSSFDREAGLARFHKTHGHYHHDAAIGLQLFKVTDVKRGKVEPAGEPRTKGFAHREELLREWDTFYPIWPSFGFGLRPGWADIYEWDRPGNYISFGLNGDGRYVVRMQADPVEEIRESNERDNFAYTYLEVSGDEVEMLEAGRGTDPWDRCKIAVGFGGHPDPKEPRRPKDCPPDTV